MSELHDRANQILLKPLCVTHRSVQFDPNVTSLSGTMW